MKHLSLLLCLLLCACQPESTHSGSDAGSATGKASAQPMASPAAGQNVARQALSSSPVASSSSLPDNPWDALAVLNPLQMAAVRQAFLDRSDKGIQDPDLRRKTNYMLQLLLSAYQGLLHPDASRSTYLPPGARSLRLSSHDGLPLRAAYVRASKPTQQAVILLHGFGANQEHVWQKYGYLRSDYNLLAYDQRGHNGQGGRVTLGYDEAQDLLMAIRWLHHQGNQSFALMGESLGGAVAIDGGTLWLQDKEQQSFPLKGVWSDAAYVDLTHAISERTEARLHIEAPNLSQADGHKMASLITQLFLSWLETDLGIDDIETLAAPSRYLGDLVKQVAYAQVHSIEDAETSYENARQLEVIARRNAVIPPVFWATTGEHVESWRDKAYEPRLRAFLSQAFARR